MKKDYYAELDKFISEYEEYKPTPQRSLVWISDRVAWCCKWKYISSAQVEELAGRVTDIFLGIPAQERWR